MHLLLACLLCGTLAAATGFDGQPAPLPLADTTVLGDGPAPEAAGVAGGVLLGDGSWLPVRTVGEGGTDAVRCNGPLGTLTLPLAAIIGWGFPEPPAAGAEDVVLVASGPLTGRVLGLADGTLRMQTVLDPEPLQLELAAVRGLRLATTVRPATGLRLRAVLDPERPPLDLLPEGPALVAAPQVIVTGLGGLRLRVEGGRRVYLSDLAPRTVQEDGAFGVVWPWQRDQALRGGPLRLGGVRHHKGIVVHSAARLAWALDGAYVRLRALAGISDAVAPQGDCVVELSGDGRTLWQARLRGGEAPQPIDLDCTGVAELVFTVTLGERHDIGDHAVLADAWLVRR